MMTRVQWMLSLVVVGCTPTEKDNSDDLDVTDVAPGDGSDSGSVDPDDTGDPSDGGPPEGTGVFGTVMWLEGNHMPGAGTGESWAVEGAVGLFATLPASTPGWDGDPEAYGLYSVDAEPLYVVDSDSAGAFELMAEAGDYTLLVADPEHDGLWYCNGFSDALCPVTVSDGEMVQFDVNIDYRAAY